MYNHHDHNVGMLISSQSSELKVLRYFLCGDKPVLNQHIVLPMEKCTTSLSKVTLMTARQCYTNSCMHLTVVARLYSAFDRHVNGHKAL